MNREKIIYIGFLLVVILLIISSNIKYKPIKYFQESYIDIPLGATGKHLNIDTENKSVSLHGNQESETKDDPGLSATPITIGPNGYPLRPPKAAHQCSPSEDSIDEGIIQKKICTPLSRLKSAAA